MKKGPGGARGTGAQDQLPEPKQMGKKTIMFVSGPDGERIEFAHIRN
jgi:hypothetical protein